MSKKQTRTERRLAWEREKAQECQCRACHELKFEHVDVHLKKNQPSPWCYQCRKDFSKEEIEQALDDTIKALQDK